MGNSSFKCTNGVVRKVRVLLPDGEIVSIDGSVEVSMLMLQYPNHMVVHCASVEQRRTRERPTMTIMQPDQVMIPGEAYLVHPIPPQYKKALFKAQPYLLSKRKTSIPLGNSDVHEVESNTEDSDELEPEDQIPRRRRQLRLVSALFPSARCLSSRKVADSGSAGESSATSLFRPETENDDSYAYADREEEEDETDVDISIYTGWRPVLESIPESPHEYHERSESPFLISSRPMEIPVQ